jgi:CBS domain-containing membrane protein
VSTAAELRVEEVMARDVVSLGPKDRLDLAEDVMRLGRIRHMPVLEGDRLVGIVSSRDLLAASLSKQLEFDGAERRTFLRSVTVSEAMTRDPITIAPGATLREAAELLLQHRIGCLPVTRPDGSFVGLLTETDLIRAVLMAEPAASTLEASAEGRNAMSELGKRLEEELEGLRRVRDELRVQIHLAKAEAKERWEELEHKFRDAEAKARLVARESEKPIQDVGAALRNLLREIRDGYRQIRETL